MTYHEVGTEFLDVLFAFGGKPRNSEAGLGNQTIKYRSDGSYGNILLFISIQNIQLLIKIKDIAYILVYTEESRDERRSSWPIRQIGVFHRYMPKSAKSLWIFVNPMVKSIFQKRLESTISRRNAPFPLNMMNIHVLVVSSYITNWRWYLNSLNAEFEEIVTYTYPNTKNIC